MLKPRENNTARNIFLNAVQVAVALFVNGLGIYFTIRANIGVGPWDVLNIGVSKTFGILYGNASIIISLIILVIDILIKEPIGLAMIIDSFVVGKAVDFFAFLDLIPESHNLFLSILFIFIGLIIISLSQYVYMISALGCGPRDALMVGLARIFNKYPLGLVTVVMQASVTFTGYLLGGPVGLGSLMIAFGYGPIVQRIFEMLNFDATAVKHQRLLESCRIIMAGINMRDQKEEVS